MALEHTPAPQPNPLIEAASFFDRSIRLFLSEAEGEAEALHAETWILAVARMAGTQIQFALAGAANAAGDRARPQAGAAQEGPRLVGLLLLSLEQLGEPLQEAAIDCPAEGSACSRLSLDQTRVRLQPLVEACGRCHGLGSGELADALVIATALAIHHCRGLVPVARGAGLAVIGLVEGAKTVPSQLAAA
jgi:hypothetical protein